MKNEMKTVPLPDSNRVTLCMVGSDGSVVPIADMHPKQAEDIMKVYNRSDKQYDALY